MISLNILQAIQPHRIHVLYMLVILYIHLPALTIHINHSCRQIYHGCIMAILTPSLLLVRKMGRKTFTQKKVQKLENFGCEICIYIYTCALNDPCFDWKRPSFGGKQRTNGFQVHIYVYDKDKKKHLHIQR